jgi:phage-related protein
VEFDESDDEGCPVQEFLDALDKPRRAKLLAAIKLLEEEGPTLPFPYSSQVRGKLRELRAHYGSEQYRVLYFGAPNRALVLLHALQKRTKKLPERDIKLAQKRMEQHLERREED